MKHPALKDQVRAAQNGDQAAFTEIIKSTQNDLYRFAYYLCGEAALAQDIVQETYIRCFLSIKQIDDPEKLSSWLHRIAKNYFLDHFRKAGNQPTQPLDDVKETLAIEGSQPELVYQMRQCLAQLDPDDRLVLILIDLEKYSYSEAAKILAITEEAVTSRVFRARQEFKKKYK